MIGDLKYTVTSHENHEVSVAASSTEISGDIVIPSTVEGIVYLIKLVVISL